MHTRLQSKVLRELYDLTPDDSQLWVSTHSIGMLKEAEDIEEENPGTVVFLDFDNRDFDLTNYWITNYWTPTNLHQLTTGHPRIYTHEFKECIAFKFVGDEMDAPNRRQIAPN